MWDMAKQTWFPCMALWFRTSTPSLDQGGHPLCVSRSWLCLLWVLHVPRKKFLYCNRVLMSPLDRLAVIVLLPERVVFKVCKQPINKFNSAEDFGQLFVDRSPSSVHAFLLFGSRHAVGWQLFVSLFDSSELNSSPFVNGACLPACWSWKIARHRNASAWAARDASHPCLWVGQLWG